MPKFLRFIIPFVIIGIFVVTLVQKNSSNLFCANSESCLSDLSGEYDSNGLVGEFMGDYLPTPQFLAGMDNTKKTLGEVSGNTKRIEVDLTNQMLYAIENNSVVMSFPVSTGKWGKTPTGTFNIWIKLRYTRMSGGNPKTNTYYNLPNVPHTMYFYNEKIPKIRGFGLHGAYWHNNFGHPMSHGCVNIGLENAGKLYDWAEPVSDGKITYASDQNPGTQVVIYGVAPNN